MDSIVKGYMVLGHDWKCRPDFVSCDTRYEVGETYEEDATPKVYEHGFHFYERLANCFPDEYFNSGNRVVKIAALGKVDTDGIVSCTNKMKIIREIPHGKLLKIANAGKGCTGFRNNGNWNTGFCNDGDFNVGNCNSGGWNRGHWNIGDGNVGDYNSGNFNSGDWNRGDNNTGDYNIGDYNSGDWNKTNFSNGCFNTTEPKIYLFDKPSEWTRRDWRDSKARILLQQIPFDSLRYVPFEHMKGKEKSKHSGAEISGGYLKKVNRSGCAQAWWRGLSEEDKEAIESIPNFDAEIFEEITGIDVMEE